MNVIYGVWHNNYIWLCMILNCAVHIGHLCLSYAVKWTGKAHGRNE